MVVQVVVQVVLAAVGRLVLDGVAVVVVVVAVAVVALQAVAADGLLGCRVEDVVGGVEGEGLSSRPGNAAQRVVFERGRAAALSLLSLRLPLRSKSLTVSLHCLGRLKGFSDGLFNHWN